METKLQGKASYLGWQARLKVGLIWIGGLALATISLLAALGAVTKNSAPALAVNVYPVNGFATEKLATDAIKVELSQNQSQFPEVIKQSILDRAEQAFLSEPITSEAIAIMAMAQSDDARLALLQTAFKLSRRESLVTGWLVKSSEERRDLNSILSYYDIVLRTSSSAGTVVIPLLARVLSNDDFIPPFEKLLLANPPWAADFWTMVANEPNSIANAARLRTRLYEEGESSDVYRDVALIGALTRNGQFTEAEALYRLLSGRDAGGPLIKKLSFSAEQGYPPLDWQLISTGEYGAVVDEGALQLSAIENSGGLFSRRLIKLPSAVIGLAVQFETELPQDAEFRVDISCAEKLANKPRTIQIQLNTIKTSQKISNMNTNCQFYWLDVYGRADEGGDGFDVALKFIGLTAN